MTRPLGIALIGTGAIAKHHARAIHATPSTRLVCCFARDVAKRDAFAAEQRCRSAVSLADALADPLVDAVLIATPSGAHLDAVEAAAAAGKHVMCEKPLDITLERTDAIIAACARHRVILCPIFQNRFGEQVQAMKAAIARGRLGRLLLGRATVKWQRTMAYFQSGSWRGTKAVDGGGVLINQAIHTVDLLLHLMGEPVELHGYVATLTHPGIEVEDTACAVLRFADGAMGVIEATTSTTPQLPVEVEVTGANGTIALRGEDIARWDLAALEAGDDAIRSAITAPGPEMDEHEARFPKHRRQLEDLAAAVHSGASETMVAPRAGRLALEVILGIYRSAATGQPYRFNRP
jgi:UDP-N-acetyl-2-amino-2-deoxyglucuronate dehydrogenase